MLNCKMSCLMEFRTAPPPWRKYLRPSGSAEHCRYKVDRIKYTKVVFIPFPLFINILLLNTYVCTYIHTYICIYFFHQGTVMKNEVIHQTCTTIFQFNDTVCSHLGSKNVTDYLQVNKLILNWNANPNKFWH